VIGGQIRRGLDATKLRAAVFDAIKTPARPASEAPSTLPADAESERNEVVST
jgi:hypothetical protein